MMISEINNDLAVSKKIFINEKRINTIHATKRFNTIKIDWVPQWMSHDEIKNMICGLKGVTGRFVDIRNGRGDKVEKDSCQIIIRFYDDLESVFDPPNYIHFKNEDGTRHFMRINVFGKQSRCMKCNEDNHAIGECPYFFCYNCGQLKLKHKHNCPNRKIKKKKMKIMKQTEKNQLKRAQRLVVTLK